MAGLISIGVSGLQAAQLGLATTEHNVTNASTPGYSRQRTVQASNIAMATGSGYIGQGVHVSTVERMYDTYLTGQVNSAQTISSELDTYYTQIQQIDNMLADANSGVSSALQDFFTGIQQVSANPSQLSSRQAMISSAQALVSRFQSMDAQISQMYDGINSQITSTVASINSYASGIASLNDSIVVAQASYNQPPNDLLDQRDQLISELNKLVKVTTTTNSNGSYNVFVGTGQQLVMGSHVSTMTSTPSSSDPTRFTVGLEGVSGNQQLPESLITGGSLGGLLNFRSVSLDQVANDLGRNAASIALTFNAQNALGQDLLGQSIGVVGTFTADFFTLSQPTVISDGGNTSNATVSASLAAPSIKGSYTLALNAAGTSYTLTRESDGITWTGNSLAAVQTSAASEGLTLTSPTVAAGYTLALNSAGTSYTLTDQSGVGGPWTGATLADLQLAQPAGLTMLPGAKVAAGYSLGLDSAGFYTLTRQSDGISWTGATPTLAALQAAVPASEGLTLTGTSIAPNTSISLLSSADNANFYTKLTNFDYRLDYDGTNYTITQLSDKLTQWSTNVPTKTLADLQAEIAESEGFSFSLASGAFASGDSFIIQPTRTAAKNIAVNAAVVADVRLIAAAMPIRTSAAGSNIGGGKISAGESLSGFGTPAISANGITLTYGSAANTLTLAGVPAGVNISVSAGGTSTLYPGPTIPYTSGATISFAGIGFDISGNLSNGDSFTVKKNTSGVSDGRNALALGQLQSQNTMSGSTASFQSAYAQLVSSTGNKAREIDVKSQAQSSLLTQFTTARDSLSGVNLDEEAANLLRYQQAYQASAKMLGIGNTLFDSLLSVMS